MSYNKKNRCYAVQRMQPMWRRCCKKKTIFSLHCCVTGCSATLSLHLGFDTIRLRIIRQPHGRGSLLRKGCTMCVKMSYPSTFSGYLPKLILENVNRLFHCEVTFLVFNEQYIVYDNVLRLSINLIEVFVYSFFKSLILHRIRQKLILCTQAQFRLKRKPREGGAFFTAPSNFRPWPWEEHVILTKLVLLFLHLCMQKDFRLPNRLSI